MRRSGTVGKLIIVGGGEDREGESAILKEFVRLAKGARSRVCVMTAATEMPEEVGAEYVAAFRRLGVKDIEVVDVSSREDASSEAAIAIVEKATGLYFTGGDQLHITSLLGGTPLHEALRRKYEAGAVIAGTSAGAAMMANSMIIGGSSEGNPRFGSVEMAPGMDFCTGVIIDTHFSQRGRHGRLLTAVAHYPQDIGLGVDEDTAMVVGDGKFEVIGAGAVTVVDAGTMTHTNLPGIGRDENLALFDISLHVLPAGHGFDLKKRQPLSEPASPKAAKPTAGKGARGAAKSKAAKAQRAA